MRVERLLRSRPIFDAEGSLLESRFDGTVQRFVPSSSFENIPRTPSPATVEPPAELGLRRRTSRWGFAIPALVGLATVAAGSGLLASSSGSDGTGSTIGAGGGLALIGVGAPVVRRLRAERALSAPGPSPPCGERGGRWPGQRVAG